MAMSWLPATLTPTFGDDFQLPILGDFILPDHADWGRDLVTLKYQCFCTAKFATKDSLNRHVRTKNDGPKYRCYHCPHVTDRSDNILGHLRSNHEGAFHAQCRICLRWIYHPKDLAHHNKHPNGFGLTCGICKRTFTSPDQYEEHMRTKHPPPRNA